MLMFSYDVLFGFCLLRNLCLWIAQKLSKFFYFTILLSENKIASSDTYLVPAITTISGYEEENRNKSESLTLMHPEYIQSCLPHQQSLFTTEEVGSNHQH